MPDLSDQIADAASGFKSGTVDGILMEAQPIEALIKADQYLALKAAAARGNRGIRFTKFIPAGSFSDRNGTYEGPCSP